MTVKFTTKKEQTPVKVIDSVMGSGKSTALFKLMKEGYTTNNTRYLYISIFNAEVGNASEGTKGRIHEELPELDFKMPEAKWKTGKVGGLKELLRKGENVATTHETFKNFDDRVIKLLVDGKYTLIIDEAVDCIAQYKDVNEFDFHMALKYGMVEANDDGLLLWKDDVPLEGSTYKSMAKLCQTECLYLYSGKLLLWEYSPKLLKELDEVYIATYLFEGSIMSSWMKKNKIEYCYLPHNVLGLLKEEDIKNIVRENLVILKSNSLTKLRGTAKGRENMFSSSWYKREKDDDEIMDSMIKIFESTVSRTKTKAGSVFWTTFKDYRVRLTGKGYRKPPKGGLDAYLVFNKKAINDYRDHTLCMYGVDVHKTTVEVNYLAERGVIFNKDLYSLSEMLQFIFRGSIRKGEEMKILVLSQRMEDLLRGWLDK